MKQFIFLLIMVTSTSSVFSQADTLHAKLDSIIREADLMFRYEKSVWESTDLLMADKKAKDNYGGYVVSHSGDSVFVTYLDKDQKESIARYTYLSGNFNNPLVASIQSSPLTVLEKELFDMKVKIVDQLSDSKYNVTFPQDFNPNLVLIKEKESYRLYIIMGTSKRGVIPFGNDYLFRADSKGSIVDWKKFHSRMIATETKGPDGEKVLSSVHSHLKTTPYISATDICTFRLYGEFCGMNEFMVLCTATGKYYKYKLSSNTIEVTQP